MSYDTYEESVQSGAPIEGFEFVGSFTTYRYTSSQVDVDIFSQTYTAIAIERNAVKATTQNDDGGDLEVTVPYDIPLVEDYAYSKAPPNLTLEIVRFHEGTDPVTDWVTIWKGIVTNFSVSGRICKIRIPSIFSVVLRGELPNVYYQGPCNHRLYDSRCGLTATSYRTQSTITAIDGNEITVAADGVDDGHLVGGELVDTTQSERRLVISNIANVLTLNFPFYGAEVGDSVDMYAGCDHSFATCGTKFSNQEMFGGFPFIPGINPFEGDI